MIKKISDTSYYREFHAVFDSRIVNNKQLISYLQKCCNCDGIGKKALWCHNTELLFHREIWEFWHHLYIIPELIILYFNACHIYV